MNYDNDDIFGLDDLSSDGQQGKNVSPAVGIVIRIILSLTTFGFFYVFAPNLFTWLVGVDVSPYLSGAVGTFLIDFLAYWWQWMRENHADTESQIKTSGNAAKFDLGLSILVTLVFFVLLTDFVATTNADGSYNAIGEAVNLLGLAIGTLAIAGNAVLYAYYEGNSSKALANQEAAKIRAMQNKGRHAINVAHNQQVVQRTVKEVTRQLPGQASTAAEQNSGEFFSGKFKRAGQPAMNQPDQPVHELRTIPVREGDHRGGEGIGFNPKNHIDDIADFLSIQANRETISRVMKERKDGR